MSSDQVSTSLESRSHTDQNHLTLLLVWFLPCSSSICASFRLCALRFAVAGIVITLRFGLALVLLLQLICNTGEINRSNGKPLIHNGRRITITISPSFPVPILATAITIPISVSISVSFPITVLAAAIAVPISVSVSFPAAAIIIPISVPISVSVSFSIAIRAATITITISVSISFTIDRLATSIIIPVSISCSALVPHWRVFPAKPGPPFRNNFTTSAPILLSLSTLVV
mmetsp:Transcript_12884/g.35586  ORF Transcript_12884/g.35586 Transcript_12884/m.35586 type:complete len:230 (+) Transcript_12884:129-818(+)